MTSNIQRFAFTAFDAQPPAPTPAPAPVIERPAAPSAPPPPAITEADLERTRTNAYAQGKEDGARAAETAINAEAKAQEERVHSLLNLIGNRIMIAAEAHSAERKTQEGVMAKLVIAVARKVAGDALRREPFAAAEALVKECAALIHGQPVVTVAVAPDMAAGLRQRLDGVVPQLAGFDGTLRVSEDETMDAQDCRVEWKNGYAERRSESLWQEIETLLSAPSAHKEP